MNKITILITAATSMTGNATARHLLELADKSKYHIRVGARSDAKIQDLIQKGAEYVRFDFRDRQSVEESLKGVDYLWLTIPNPPSTGLSSEMSRMVASFVDQVKAAKIKHVVFGTVEGADDPNKNYRICQEFRVVEKQLQHFNIPATYLRMGWFQENVVTHHAEEIGQGSTYEETMNNGLNGYSHLPVIPIGTYTEPINDSKYTQVSVEDIGEAAATVLLNPSAHVNKSYHLTGPRAVSGAEIAKILSDVLQRPIEFVNLALEHYEQVLNMTMPAEQVKYTIELYEVIRSGFATHVSNDYYLLTGKQYITIEERFKKLKEKGLLR